MSKHQRAPEERDTVAARIPVTIIFCRPQRLGVIFVGCNVQFPVLHSLPFTTWFLNHTPAPNHPNTHLHTHLLHTRTHLGCRPRSPSWAGTRCCASRSRNLRRLMRTVPRGSAPLRLLHHHHRHSSERATSNLQHSTNECSHRQMNLETFTSVLGQKHSFYHVDGRSAYH